MPMGLVHVGSSITATECPRCGCASSGDEG
jgi:hypothetical protein